MLTPCTATCRIRLWKVILTCLLTVSLLCFSAIPAQSWTGKCRNQAHGNIGVYYEDNFDHALGPGIWIAERSWLYHYETGRWFLGSPEFQYYVTENWLYPSSVTIGGAGDRSFITDRTPGNYAIWMEVYLYGPGGWTYAAGNYAKFEAGNMWCQV